MSKFKDFKLPLHNNIWEVKFVDKVITADTHNGELLGVCDCNSYVIQVKKDQAVGELVDTVLHEINHAMLGGLMNFGALHEETLVRILSKSLFECIAFLPKELVDEARKYLLDVNQTKIKLLSKEKKSTSKKDAWEPIPVDLKE